MGNKTTNRITSVKNSVKIRKSQGIPIKPEKCIRKSITKF